MRSFIVSAIGSLCLILSLINHSSACTCFCLDTPEGPVFGSNLDLLFPADGLVFINHRGIEKEGFEASPTGETAKWVSKYGSVTFNLAGREWAFGGMNEAGLVLGSMELLKAEFPEPDHRPGLPIGVWAQYVLDTCGSVEEAIEVDSRVRIEDAAPPIHYLIADASGNCVAIEWLDGEFVCYSGEDLPVKAMSNMRYASALAAYEQGGPSWWWSNPGQSAERFATAHERNESYDASRDPNAVNYAFGTLIHGVVAPHTKWSIVYDIGKREIWYGTVVSQPVKHISFENVDFSCDAPLKMLDVNAPLEGDVEESFIPYDSETNLKVLHTLCERYGMGISEDVASGVVRHIDSFECAE
ncbi:MAG: linear amide C-N hydrolase [Candidatus Omnitrophica bacterium]|nr:linear amide C-N hydrolase [Candidatus Omnitrophota bacterium]